MTTSFVSPNTLRATLPESLLTSPGVVAISVFTPSPGGGTSSSKTFTVLSEGVVSATNNPQVASYSLTSPRDATVTIEFGPDTNYGLRTWSVPTPAGGGEVEILVAGMTAFTTHHLRAMVEFPEGITHFDTDHTFITGGLSPEDMPGLSVTQPAGFSPQPGVQLVHLNAPNTDLDAVVTDLAGNIIWFYDGLAGGPFPIQFLPNGNFLVVDSATPTLLREFDLAGNTLREISAPDVNAALVAKGMEPVANRFHHDAIMLPNGHFMVLTNYIKSFTDLVGLEGQTVNVVGDGLVELDENLEPVWVWSTFDHMDVNRHPFSNPSTASNFDWTHGNAVVYSPADRNLLLSLRHQHWVVKIDYQDGFGSGNILWRLGRDGDFALLSGGDDEWQYAQHFPVILDNQMGFYRLAVFDNGNQRPVDDSGTQCSGSGVPCFSRAVIFEIDEAMMTARVFWEDNLEVYAFAVGSIQVLDNGNVLFDAGVRQDTSGVTAQEAIIREVTQEDVPQTVWQLDVSSHLVYRSVRMPSLYPGVQW